MSSTNDIEKQLDQLANFRAEKDYLGLYKQELIDQVLTPEIKARLEEIEAEFAGRLQAVDENITALEGEIRQAVIQHGETVRGSFLRAIWHKGRVTWDTQGMERFSRAHPEVLAYRKQGEPFISITKIETK